MLRSFKYFQIVAGGTPQPLVGTTTTAAVKPTVQVPPQNTLVIPVADASMFQSGDWAIIGKPSSNQEKLLVQSVSGNNLTVQIPPSSGIMGSYPSGTYVRLGNAINSTYVQTKDGNAGAIYVGTMDDMVKATGVFVVAKLQPVGAGSQPVDFHDGRSGLANVDNIGQLWVDGTTGDSYLPTVGVV